MTTRSEAHDALPHLGAVETPLSPYGLRIQPGEDGRGPAVQSEPEFIKGWIEIQDEGSQIAAIFSGVQPEEQVVDLCAGGGGKTLALAAMMNNHGQLYATDSDARRLAPIHERVTRAGIRNVQIRTPRARADAVADLDGKIDCVVVDAPCTGIGTWRRNPDAKWRLRPGSLDVRRNEQAVVLDRAGALRQIRAAASSTSPARSCPRRTTRPSRPSSPAIPASPPVPVAGGAGPGRDGEARAACPQHHARPADDAAEDRHGRILRGGASARIDVHEHRPATVAPKTSKP